MKSPPDKMTNIKNALRPIGAFTAAWTFLNVLMNVRYPFPEDELSRLLLISPEILTVLVLVSLWASLRMPFHRALLIPLTLIILFLRLFRLADSLVPMYFNRPFNCYLDSQHSPLIKPFLRGAERKLQDRGYLIASNFLRSPAYGGASWLAHGSLASGVPINSQLRYDLLLTSRVQPIAEYFNQGGSGLESAMDRFTGPKYPLNFR